MKAVYKYNLHLSDREKIYLPAGAKVLCVQVQFDQPCIWALVDKDTTAVEERTFLTLGTGYPIENAERLSYVGTFQLRGGALVFHVFEESTP